MPHFPLLCFLSRDWNFSTHKGTFYKNTQAMQSQGPDSESGRLKLLAPAVRRLGREPGTLASLGTSRVYRNRGQGCYLRKKMIRNLESFSPLTLIKIENLSFRKSRTKVCLLNKLFNSSKYRLSVISREKIAS